MFSVTLDLELFVLVAVEYPPAMKFADRMASLLLASYGSWQRSWQRIPGAVELGDVVGKCFQLRFSVLKFALA